jgi:outer membrane scaffolding protein for murein synthesis (MipA/OmpV family)
MLANPCPAYLPDVPPFAVPDFLPLTHPFRRVQLSACFLSSCLLAGLTWSSTSLADTGDEPATDPNAITLALGAGIERLPSFPGAKTHRNEPIPYVDFEWPDHVSLSTLDGLQVDLIGGSVLHGGLFGDYQWGRDTDDLSPRLREKLNPLSPRLTAGGYLEWQLTKQIDVGTNLSHDINGAGSYLNVYAEWDLPKVWLIEHSLQVRWQAMNGPAMSRFFGITPTQASLLNVPTWRPGTGSQLADLEYDVFVPTSQHTGVALALTYGRLLGNAADSPLVTRFGSATQISESLAFVYHF